MYNINILLLVLLTGICIYLLIRNNQVSRFMLKILEESKNYCQWAGDEYVKYLMENRKFWSIEFNEIYSLNKIFETIIPGTTYRKYIRMIFNLNELDYFLNNDFYKKIMRKELIIPFENLKQEKNYESTNLEV